MTFMCPPISSVPEEADSLLSRAELGRVPCVEAGDTRALGVFQGGFHDLYTLPFTDVRAILISVSEHGLHT